MTSLAKACCPKTSSGTSIGLVNFQPTGALGEELVDLPQREPEGARAANEAQRLHIAAIVGTVAIGEPLGGLEETQLLVEADGLGRHAGARRGLADRHALPGFHVSGRRPRDARPSTSGLGIRYLPE